MSEKEQATYVARKLPYSLGLTLGITEEMLKAGVEEAEKKDMFVSIAIVDAGGNLLAFNRMDNAMLGSIQIAIDKAFTAAFGKRPTGDWKKLFQNGELTPLFFHERWITFPGGFPIISNGVLLGGIGVSGGIDKDSYIAKAALRAGDFCVDE